MANDRPSEAVKRLNAAAELAPEGDITDSAECADCGFWSVGRLSLGLAMEHAQRTKHQTTTKTAV